MDERLPFEIEALAAGGKATASFFARRDKRVVACGRYVPGALKDRERLAAAWSTHPELSNGTPTPVEAIRLGLERAELAVLEKTVGDMDSDGPTRECASYVDHETIAELAWNNETGEPDFLVYDRATRTVRRDTRVKLAGITIVLPRGAESVCTSGGARPGCVLLPTEYDEAGIDEDAMREQLAAFVQRYVELPAATVQLCIEYILMSWVFDAFSELPFMAYRTAERGRGKTRCLTTMGSCCYRPLRAGGGTSAAALLRIIDLFGGTLLCDEFDMRRGSDLAAEVGRIVNLGFEKGQVLLKCQGDDHQPVPHYVFGPKLFALRGRFADDANESRIISVWMRQRTRPDIPISLPRTRFDAEALRLRNRLLAWRFANLGAIAVNEEHADTGLEDRANQLALPLMRIAGTPDGRRIIADALREQQRSLAADRADSLPGEVLETILKMASVGDTVRPKDVANRINQQRADDNRLDLDKLPKDQRLRPQTVGKMLGMVLELPKGRDGSGVYYTLASGHVELLTARYGLTPPQPTQPTCLHSTPEPTPENQPDGGENADRVGRVGCVGSPGMAGEPTQQPTSDTSADEETQAVMEFGGDDTPVEIPVGWSASGWAGRLDQLAGRSESVNPTGAAAQRKQASRIRAAIEAGTLEDVDDGIPF